MDEEKTRRPWTGVNGTRERLCPVMLRFSLLWLSLLWFSLLWLYQSRVAGLYKVHVLYTLDRPLMNRGQHMFFLLAVFIPLHLAGQTGGQDRGALQRNSIDVVGVATLADGSLQGTSVDRRLFLLGFTYSRLLTRNRVADTRFTSEAIPLALLREPFFRGFNIQALTSERFTEMRETYGAGASPVGIEIDWLPQKKLQPFFGVQGGFLYFDRNVLNFRGAQFNFTFDVRAGVRIQLHQGRSIAVAYMFQHMSNAYEAAANPGLDAHMISLSYRFPFRFRHRGR